MTRSRLRLRNLDPRVLPLAQRAGSWRAAGYSVAIRTESIRPGDIRFEATADGRRYVGWADAIDLARHAYPAWRDVAWQAMARRYLIDLLNEDDAMSRAVVSPPGGWTRIRCIGIDDADHVARPALRIDAPGRVAASFVELPDLAAPWDCVERVPQLPIRLRFVLGSTRISVATLQSLRGGDAVLIQERVFNVTVGARRLCAYSIEGNSIMLDELENDAQASASEAHCDQRDARASDGQPFDVAALPVKLECVLQHTELSVADVAQLHAGAILPLEPDAERHVTLYANGRCLAQGELIQVGERLAVEIQSIEYAEPK
ncbi:type III secretion system cytoplasmic ring protein SctQ [Burkholderia ubonensis]|uniref:type III secretion system cytoplasmic ring protein SctQ n=1 Tax=Burkholderia ubonensis TaxID=101571 RepID=UPI00075239D9|nr:type III secretion system cytoplasmic ring protein SctQ [Burkholderia ubonensis]KVC71751.1 hypothetical protein WI75_25560 [Burkholderia ubonensis]